MGETRDGRSGRSEAWLGGKHHTVTDLLRSPLAHDADRPEMPRSGAAEANSSLRLMGAAPLPPEVDDVIRSRFAIDTFSGAYGVTEASLISWQPKGVQNRPGAAGVGITYERR